jgi:hypothetical protein
MVKLHSQSDRPFLAENGLSAAPQKKSVRTFLCCRYYLPAISIT